MHHVLTDKPSMTYRLQLNYDIFPGETVAVREVLGLDTYRICRTPFAPTAAYLVVE